MEKPKVSPTFFLLFLAFRGISHYVIGAHAGTAIGGVSRLVPYFGGCCQATGRSYRHSLGNYGAINRPDFRFLW